MQSFANPERAAALRGRSLPRHGLFGAESALLAIIVLLLVATILRDLTAPSRVMWSGFAPVIAATFALVGLGVFIRLRRNMPEVSAFAVSFGIFTGFSAVISIFVFQMFPFDRPTIDPVLMALDARLGYDWASFLRLLAEWPEFGQLLGWVYHWSLPKLVVVIVALAMLRRERALHRFLWVGVAGLTVTVVIWQVLPSLGPSTLHSIPAEASKIGLVVNADYAARMMAYAVEGVPEIRPDLLMGVIAFPSFHMFMACMGFWFARGTVVFPVVAVVCLLMIPATLAHGGHHLVDLIAGMVLFSVLVAVVSRLLPDHDAAQEAP